LDTACESIQGQQNYPEYDFQTHVKHTRQARTSIESQLPSLITTQTTNDPYHVDGDLCLEEVDVLCEVERVLATVTDHVRVQDVVGALEDSDKMSEVDGALQWKLK